MVSQISSGWSPCSETEFGLLDAAPIAMALCSGDFRIAWANAAFSTKFATDTSSLTGKSLIELLYPSSELGAAPVEKLQIGAQEVCLKISENGSIWLLVTISKAPENLGRDLKIVQITQIDDQKEEQASLAYTEGIWRTAISAARYGVWDYYAPTDTRFFSDEWKIIRGIPVAEEVRESRDDWEARIHPDDRERVSLLIERAHARKGLRFAYEYRERRRDGKLIWIYSRGEVVERYPDGSAKRVIGADVDVTNLKEEEAGRAAEAKQKYQLHLAELELAQQATEAARKLASEISKKDSLTGIHNRRVFADRLDGLTSGCTITDDNFAVFLIDLDRFKPVNDTYGHIVGDKVICEVARRLQECIEDCDTLARLGGDEFGIIVDQGNANNIVARAELLAQQIIENLNRLYKIGRSEIEIGASIGITLYPNNAIKSQSLLKTADIAMYHVKHNKELSFAFFRPEMGQQRVLLSQLENDTRQAVRKTQIKPFFQPIIDLRTGKLDGFEVLARWNHTERGPIPPSQFIPIIEQFDLTKKFGMSMLEQACMHAREWPSHLRINFNMSAKGICDAGMPDRILGLLQSCGMSPDRLGVEVSEKSLVDNLDIAQQVIDRLRAAGITVALDDFGVGYSGLSYLQQLTFDVLKLDRSFVMAMTKSRQSEKIVMSVLSLAKEFNMQTIAEGIETEAVHRKVISAGFDFAQGFLFSKAISPEAALDFIRQDQMQKKLG